MRYRHVASRLFNVPLLVEPSKLNAIIAGLAPRFGLDELELPDVPGLYTTQRGEKRAPGYRVLDGVAVIDVFGGLVHRGRMEADSTYLLGYQDVARRLDAALADHDVGALLFQLDSPGGEVAGAFELAAQIYAARGVKPMTSVVSDVATSGAYLQAAAVGDISVSATGYTGSIGVRMQHIDMSRLLANEGIVIEDIYAGAAKIDGAEWKPLSPAARERFQANVSAIYDQFVAAVAEYRGLSPAHVRATEARVFLGQAGVDIGLADRIETPDQAIARLRAQIIDAGHAPIARSESMSIPTNPSEPGSGAAAAPAATQQPAAPAAPKAPAITEQQLADAVAAGRIEGARAERERIGLIVDSSEAEGRAQLARHLAFGTDLTAEQAVAVLGASPKETPAAAPPGKTPFERAMRQLGNPDVGADPQDGGNDEAAVAASIAKYAYA